VALEDAFHHYFDLGPGTLADSPVDGNVLADLGDQLGGNKGTPVMFFASPDANKKKVPTPICDEMEGALIQAALYENPDLRNVQKAKVPAWGIDGVLRGQKGKPTNAETGFKKMMGL